MPLEASRGVAASIKIKQPRYNITKSPVDQQNQQQVRNRAFGIDHGKPYNFSSLDQEVLQQIDPGEFTHLEVPGYYFKNRFPMSPLLFSNKT